MSARWSSRRARIALWSSILAGALLVAAGPSRPASASSSARSCALASAAGVRAILGMSQEYVSAPAVAADGSDQCAWHTTQPNCFVRTFAIRVRSAPEDVQRFQKASAAALPFARAGVFGRGSFFESEILPPGSAIMIDHLYVPRGQTWVEYTLAGRLGPDGSHAQLAAAAMSVG